MGRTEKQMIYLFFLILIVFSSIFIYEINKSEKELYNEVYSESNEILKSIENSSDTNNESYINNTNSSDKGKSTRTGKVIAFIKIEKLNLFYPILSETTMDNLKISPTKLWGNNPNEVGNFCIIGHNLKNNEQFSNLNKLEILDKIEIMNTNGNKVSYEIYDIYNVNEHDLSFSTQNTDGKREVSLITCTNNNSTERLIIKCREC
jgi:LPXTG-site transpeptidase (sortase) family protein